jgi:protein-S-isoprenylcysteine O-methyltransferase Ste14
MSEAPVAPSNVPPRAPRSGSLRRALQIVATQLLWIAGLFCGAGRLDWTRGWISVALYVIGMAALGLVVRRYNPQLLEARAKWRHADTKGFDKAFLSLLLPLAFLQPVLAGLDAVRFGWSSMAPWLIYPGAILFTIALALIGWTMVTNRYAETSVRIQTDRGHTVISSGPYRFVRHPMYVGAILMYLAIPLIWGSMWALALSGVIVILFLWRTAMEDRTLRRELPGYEEYAAHTRFRLVPRLW